MSDTTIPGLVVEHGITLTWINIQKSAYQPNVEYVFSTPRQSHGLRPPLRARTLQNTWVEPQVQEISDVAVFHSSPHAQVEKASQQLVPTYFLVGQTALPDIIEALCHVEFLHEKLQERLNITAPRPPTPTILQECLVCPSILRERPRLEREANLDIPISIWIDMMYHGWLAVVQRPKIGYSFIQIEASKVS